MKINFNCWGANEVKNDLENLQKFKNRWINLISGFDPDPREEDLQLTQALLAAESNLENLLFELEEAEQLEEMKKVK